MDVIKAIETYVTKLVAEPAAMKVLLLDTHTVRHRLSASLIKQIQYSIDAHSFFSIHTIHTSLASGLSH
jgi:hypothetical protein